MPSLAQSIIETAHNMSRKPDKTRMRYAEDYFRTTTKAFNNEAQAAQIAMMSAEVLNDIPKIAPLIKQALRFSIDQNVADAIVKMVKTPDATMLQAIKYATPPHNPTWIEFCLPEGDLKVGWLVHSKDDGLHVHYVFSTSTLNHMPTYMADIGHSRVTPEGFFSCGMKGSNPDLSKKQDETAAKNCREALSIMMLLNSRSKILTTQPPSTDLTKINRARLKNGKEEILPMNTIVFDIARIIQKSGKTTIDAIREMAAALVRGHFKVRQTGVFFWTPYVRSARDEEHRKEVYDREIASERRETIVTGPYSLPEPM